MRNRQATVTRNQPDRLTIEKLAHDCLDVRALRRKGFFDDGWVTIGPSLKWPRIARLRIARYLILLDIRGRSDLQRIRVSWTNVHLGGNRPWMHCPYCETRAARLYAGLGGYFCRACVGRTHPTRVSSSALKAEPTIKRVSSAFCWMVKPSYQRHFRSAHPGCTGARTSGSDERDWI